MQQFTLLWSTSLLGLMYAATVIGVFHLVRERRWTTLVLLLIVIAYFFALSAGPEANSRFRIPIVPFFAVLAGVGIDSLIIRYRTRRSAHHRATRTQNQLQPAIAYDDLASPHGDRSRRVQ